jgi:Cu/Ag efflux pump CusA
VKAVHLLINSGMRFGRLVIAVSIGLLLLAVTQLRSAPIDVYPEFNPPSVEIQTEALGLSAAEVEQLITVPLEQDLLNGVPWLDRIHSISMPGLSAIDLTFHPGTNLYAARQMVEERMTQAHALPNVGSPPIMIQPLSSLSRVAMIRLSSQSVPLIDMSVLARWKIRPRLMGVPGVANVAIFGQRDRQLQVLVDPRRLGAQGVSLTQVIETAGNALWVSPLTFVEASTPGTGGFVESPNQRLNVQHISPISDPAQLASVAVQGFRDSGTLRLGDVAKVIVDHQPLIGDAAAGGAPSLYLVVEKSPGANTLAVTSGVEHALAEMAPGLRGIAVDSHVYRPATYLEIALKNIGLAGLIGLVLLVIVLCVALASWRAALIGAGVAAVSLSGAAYVLYLRGATFTTMTLLGLAAAVVVCIDDVITDVDAARRRLNTMGATGTQPRVTMTEAFSAVRGPLIFATLAIAVSTVPFLALGSLATAFTRPLVLSYGLAVLVSMLVAFTLTPTLAVLLLRGRAAGPGWFALRLKGGARRLLASSAASPRRMWSLVAAIATAGALAAAGASAGASAHSVLPALQDRNLLLRLETVPGTSLREMDRVSSAVVRTLRSMPAIADVGAHAGRAIGSDQTTDVNTAEVWVTLKDSASYGRSLSAIKATMRDFSGVKATLLTYPADRLAQAAAGQKNDLVVIVYGAEFGTLQTEATRIRAMLAHVAGVADPVVRAMPMQPTVDIEVKLASADKYGLRPGDVRRDVTTLTSGLIVGNLYEQSKIYDVVVWGSPQVRGNLNELRNLLVDTPSGRQVALKDVASVRIRPEPTAITHDDVLRSAQVTARITGDPSAVTAAVRSAVAHMPMPYEYHAEVYSNAVSQRTVLIRSLAFGAVALAIVLLLFQAVVGSWRRAALMLACLPPSLAGCGLAALLVGGVLSAGSLVALFAVFALAIRASVLTGRLMPAAWQEPAADGGPDGLDVACERAVPVVVSALAIAAMVLPAAIFPDGAGLENLRPLAITMLGGLASLVVVQAFVLPALLLRSAGRWSARQRLGPGEDQQSWREISARA